MPHRPLLPNYRHHFGSTDIFHRGAGDMASAEPLPEMLVTRCLDVLRILSSSERELFMLIVEIVHELRDTVRIGDEPVRPLEHQDIVGAEY